MGYKRGLIIFSKITVVILLILLVLNLQMTSRQGINYQVSTIKIPLYIKIIEFLDRDYQYKKIVKEVTRGCNTAEEKVLALFYWTHSNIRKVPEDFPIVDDHVLNIIIRGYGTSDQFSDIFATLCNYAGIDAFFSRVYTQDRKRMIILSFVKIKEKWYAFDPYRGVYFKDTQGGGLIDIETIKSKKSWLMERGIEEPEIDYTIYLNNLPSIREMGLNRSNIQSPLRRLIYQMKVWLSLS